MESMLSNLPTWGLLVLGVVWLAFQFVQKFLETQGKKREARARQEWREANGSSVPPPSGLRSDDTGRHDLRRIYDEEREREQRSELLTSSRQHGQLLQQLVQAETGQTALLQRLVEDGERQDRVLEQLADTQRAIVRYLTGPGGTQPGGTLRNLKTQDGGKR